jgi:hypothetical protein
MFWKKKPEDKMWYQLTYDINKKVSIIWLIGMVIYLVISIVILDAYPIKDFMTPLIILFISIVILYWQDYYLSRAICRVVQKQQEQIDKLLQVTGIAKSGPELSPEVHDKLINRLTGLLSNEDADTRRFAVELLGDIGDKRVIAPLTELLSDSNKTIVETVKQVIEKLR